tara:strand:+ start:502 stop:789 length:288 start_codon:yes stop_codon:yes gene_type:complete
MGFVGKILISTSFREGAEEDSNVVGRARSIPNPGLNSRANANAIDIAIAVVKRYKESVFRLIDPSLELEDIDTTPHTSEKKTKGTITSLKEAIKI